MADDPQVRAGTRYDALRIVAIGDPATAIGHLKKYLIEDADRQLQMGAVSGLADVESPAVTESLINSLSFLKNRNRQLCIEGLLRTEARSDALKQAMAKNKNLVQPDEIESLRKR
jgi:hypothetical protein